MQAVIIVIVVGVRLFRQRHSDVLKWYQRFVASETNVDRPATQSDAASESRDVAFAEAGSKDILKDLNRKIAAFDPIRGLNTAVQLAQPLCSGIKRLTSCFLAVSGVECLECGVRKWAGI